MLYYAENPAAEDKGRGRKNDEDEILKFFMYSCSAADAAAVNPKGIKTLLPNGLITFLSMVILFLVMDQELYQEITLILPS